MKLLGSNENKTTKNKNNENVPHLEITEVVLVHCNIAIMIINKVQESYIHLFQISCLAVYYKFLQKIISFIYLNQNFKPLKYGLQIKIVNHYK